jgi:hypothetical protein
MSVNVENQTIWGVLLTVNAGGKRGVGELFTTKEAAANYGFKLMESDRPVFEYTLFKRTVDQ